MKYLCASSKHPQDSLHLYYNVTYSVGGDVFTQTVQPTNCSSICSYNITEDSVSDFFIMGVNDVGPGERKLCNRSKSDSVHLLYSCM